LLDFRHTKLIRNEYNYKCMLFTFLDSLAVFYYPWEKGEERNQSRTNGRGRKVEADYYGTVHTVYRGYDTRQHASFLLPTLLE